MHRNTKVATCNYCGTRAALVLSDDHHVLVCQSCGAPLSQLKCMPGRPEATHVVTPPATFQATKPSKPKKSKKRKRKKSVFKRIVDDVFDEIEDLFD